MKIIYVLVFIGFFGISMAKIDKIETQTEFTVRCVDRTVKYQATYKMPARYELALCQ